MKLTFQVGKYYRTRDRRKAMNIHSSDDNVRRFVIEGEISIICYRTNESGVCLNRKNTHLDIVGEWAEPKPRNPAKEIYKRAMSEQRREKILSKFSFIHARINFRSHMSEHCVDVGYIFNMNTQKYYPKFRNMHEGWLKVPNQKGYPKSLDL